MHKMTLLSMLGLVILGLAGCGGPAPWTGEAPASHLANWQPSLHLADTSLAGGAPGIALQVADELLAAHPDNPDALDRRGEALAALGRLREANEAFRLSLAAAPRDMRTLLALGRLRLIENPADAEQIFTKIVTLDPHNAAALNDLGIACDLQAHHQQAQAAYRQALAAQPTSASAQINLGVSMALSGNEGAAEQLLRPLAKEPGASRKVRQDLALALTLGGKVEEAKLVLARDLDPEDVRRTVAGFRALRP
jgi:Flp pilus assembly protein TadD